MVLTQVDILFPVEGTGGRKKAILEALLIPAKNYGTRVVHVLCMTYSAIYFKEI